MNSDSHHAPPLGIGRLLFRAVLETEPVWRRFPAGKADAIPGALKREGAVFAEPLLVAEVEYRAWTQDGKLRHPSFKGIGKPGDNSTVSPFFEMTVRGRRNDKRTLNRSGV